MGYSSASEGEIVESEEETKATTKTHISSKDGTVDRDDRPRTQVSRHSRPPQLDGAYDEDDDAIWRGGLDYEDGGVQQRQTRGQKRPPPDARADHYSDPRRFKVHYEGANDRSSYDDRRERNGQREQKNGRDRGSDKHRSRQDGGSRGYDHSRYERSYQRSLRPSDQFEFDYSRSRRSSTHSGNGREYTPSHDRPGSKDRLDKKINSGVSGQPNGEAKSATHGDESEQAEPATVMDENALIEERRKRREALRAKHKQETPLLHRALHVMAQDPQAASPPGSSPSTPQVASPGSPALISVADDAELANRPGDIFADQDEGEGPSAADYDPSMDMQEDRLHNERPTQHGEAPAAAYDETKDGERDTMVPNVTTKEPKSAANKEFDMFADEDDDDMFATENQTKGHRKDDGTQAVHMPEAKQLDRNLLDDWDDPDGYYRIILGELLDGRYHVQTNLGKGVFSAVVRALDTKTNGVVAIKIIRKQESMYRAGVKEIETLQKLADADPEDKKHLIRLERQFEHKGHLCMVFENLSINLREVLKKFGRDVGINIKAVRSYAQQMFLGLSLLKKCDLIHADLKPDNVLVNESRSQLKIADLGSALAAEDNEITDVLVSRFYRAPEVMLGIKGDTALDMWSIGCTLFELYTGKICFTGPTNNQMLKGIMECRGKIPNRMLKKSEYWAQHFDPDGTFLSQETDTVTHKDVIRRTNITRTIPAKELRTRLFANAKGLSPADAKELNLFADLLDKCLALDPQRRIVPNEALKHGFISRAAPASGTKA